MCVRSIAQINLHCPGLFNGVELGIAALIRAEYNPIVMGESAIVTKKESTLSSTLSFSFYGWDIIQITFNLFLLGKSATVDALVINLSG